MPQKMAMSAFFKWAADHGLDWFTPVPSAQAAQYGHVNVLEFIWKTIRDFHSNTAARAAEHGQVSVLR